ncbi:MAG: hypothetical protein JNL74_00555, partial [Fibrobacteres bacterium]|nr:hypothetical protein [Fibrobacterota bacterium]
MYFIKMKTIILLLLIFFSVYSQNPNSGWEHLFANKTIEAHEAFLSVYESAEPVKAASAARGLAELYLFEGNRDSCALWSCRAFVKDKNYTLVSANFADIILSKRSGDIYDECIDVIKELSETPGLFSGHFKDYYAMQLLSSGKLSKAENLVKKMGVINEWKAIGPFDNTSMKGWRTIYEPEKEINLTAKYKGKDGNIVEWRTIRGNRAKPWVFVEEHFTAENAVHYFYTCVNADYETNCNLSFGASGIYQVFLNGKCVFADSVFRNTGVDNVICPVVLTKGRNALLIKLGHEKPVKALNGKLSNFSLRFIDSKYNGLQFITTCGDEFNVPASTPQQYSKNLSPASDSITAYLDEQIKTDPANIENLVSIVRYCNSVELTDMGQSIAEKIVLKYPNSAYALSLLHESLTRSLKTVEAEKVLAKAADLCQLYYDGWQLKLNQVYASGSIEKVLDFLNKSPANYKSSTVAIFAYLNAAYSLGNDVLVRENLKILEENYSADPYVAKIIATLNIKNGMPDKAVEALELSLSQNMESGDLAKELAEKLIQTGKSNKAFKVLENATKYASTDANIPYMLARLHFYNNRPKESLKYIDKCIEIMPFSANVLNMKG